VVVDSPPDSVVTTWVSWPITASRLVLLSPLTWAPSWISSEILACAPAWSPAERSAAAADSSSAARSMKSSINCWFVDWPTLRMAAASVTAVWTCWLYSLMSLVVVDSPCTSPAWRSAAAPVQPYWRVCACRLASPS
jgi:hypothetical protein